MITPLLALEEDQKSAIGEIQGCNPCILNGETMTKELLLEIRSSVYFHVLVSLEIAISKKDFRKFLQPPDSQQRLILAAIDEVHLVED